MLVGTGTLRDRELRPAWSRTRRPASGAGSRGLAARAARLHGHPQRRRPARDPAVRRARGAVIVVQRRRRSTSRAAAEVEVVRLPAGELTVRRRAAPPARGTTACARCCARAARRCSSALLHERLLDELFLTVAPKLTGAATGPALTSGPELPSSARLALAGVLERAGLAVPALRADRIKVCATIAVARMASWTARHQPHRPDRANGSSARCRRPASARWRSWPSVSEEDLERVHSTLMSPLVWDLGHIAAFEDLWLAHRYGEQPMLREISPTSTTRSRLRAPAAATCRSRPGRGRDYLDEVRSARCEVIDRARRRATATIAELIVRHEQQHNETMLQTLQLARLDGYELRRADPHPRRATAPRSLHRPRAGRGPGRAVHDRRRGATVLRLRQRASAAPHRRARLPDRAHADHQRDLSDVRGGRWLRAARVVV